MSERLLLEDLVSFSRESHHANRVFKAGMTRARKDQVEPRELLNPAKALHEFEIQRLAKQRRQRDIAEHRILISPPAAVTGSVSESAPDRVFRQRVTCAAARRPNGH
jgi:hypothetical protein